MEDKIVAFSDSSKKNLLHSNSKSLTEVNKLADEWSTLFDDIERAQRGIMEILNSDVLRKPIPSTDLDEIRTEMEKIKSYEEAMRPMQKRVEYLLYRGCYLIRSGFPTVDTSQLESQLKKLSES